MLKKILFPYLVYTIPLIRQIFKKTSVKFHLRQMHQQFFKEPQVVNLKHERRHCPIPTTNITRELDGQLPAPHLI